MSQGISECCVSGHLHDGKPQGAVTEIDGLKAYVAEPDGGSKDKTIIFITDIFGYNPPVRYHRSSLV
jgi:dienelactone hydrolase